MRLPRPPYSHRVGGSTTNGTPVGQVRDPVQTSPTSLVKGVTMGDDAHEQARKRAEEAKRTALERAETEEEWPPNPLRHRHARAGGRPVGCLRRDRRGVLAPLVDRGGGIPGCRGRGCRRSPGRLCAPRKGRTSRRPERGDITCDAAADLRGGHSGCCWPSIASTQRRTAAGLSYDVDSRRPPGIECGCRVRNVR
jgi:hypothetical protein